MKKILMLGGSTQQIVAIEAAKRLGYYTVLCDFLPDNPGQYVADKFYLISTTDREAVLNVARDEKIDGVIAYASDPAAPTAAYVADRLHLPGNPLSAVETLCNKDLFRKFLATHGFNVPKTKAFDNDEEIDLTGLVFPIIIKPADSSGSKGVTVLYEEQGIKEAAGYAFSYSRIHRIIIEEYIEKAHPYLIGGDIFIDNGKVILWGLLNCHRDNNVNPLVPVGKSYPLSLSPDDEELAHSTLQRMITELSYHAGGMNVELIIDKNHKCWLIDVGPRNGGNMISDLLGMIFNVDVVEMSIRTAMGESVAPKKYFATHNLHSSKDGLFQNVSFSPEIIPFIVRKTIYKKSGDEVHYFQNAGDAIGIVFFRFSQQEEMERLLGNINNHIFVNVLDKQLS